MESQPQNPEFRMNPENFHPWTFCNENNGHQYRVQTCFFMYFHGLTKRITCVRDICWSHNSSNLFHGL